MQLLQSSHEFLPDPAKLPPVVSRDLRREHEVVVKHGELLKGRGLAGPSQRLPIATAALRPIPSKVLLAKPCGIARERHRIDQILDHGDLEVAEDLLQEKLANCLAHGFLPKLGD